MPLRFKTGLLLIFSIWMSVYAVKWTFIDTGSCYISIFNTFDVDLMDLSGGSMRIIALFAWKQTVLSTFRVPKSTLINEPVTILWT